jgi:hypothetical protein
MYNFLHKLIVFSYLFLQETAIKHIYGKYTV